MTHYTTRDWLAAAVVFLVVLAIGACNLTTGLPDWGDDNAAYINEAIAIAEG